ncbi:MAG: DNA polymerase I [Anaerostipes sp.]|nr:DNA polymerase I [Anaerostipes sp.]
MNKLLLIDGHSILNRAFYGLPDMTNSQGLHTNAILGFLNMMFKFIEEEQPTHFAVAFDLSAPTFRHKMFEEYKGTRKGMPDELREQVPVIKEVLQAMNIPLMMEEGFEADDLLGSMSVLGEKEGYEVRIISGDRDLLQLATKHVQIRIPKTKRGGTEVEDYFADDVLAAYEVTPKEFIDVKALMGDASDNIPGIPGIGEKTATKLIKEYKTIENAREHIEDVKPNRAKNNLEEYYEQGLMSKELATIKLDCPLDLTFEDAMFEDIYTKEAYDLLKNLEFKTILKRFEGVAEEDLVLEIHEITDLSEADDVFIKAAKEKEVGVAIYTNEGDVWIAMSYEDKKIDLLHNEGFISTDYLYEKVSGLYHEGKKISMMGIKDYLGKLHLSEEQTSIFDVSLAAYLVNPLKSTYDYDDIARDYLSLMLPSRKELLEKKKSVFEDGELIEVGKKIIGFDAYVARCAIDPLTNKLDELNMLNLYEEVELPTTFVLHEMQVRGIRVDKEALKEYGGQLVGRIDQLQKLIYEEAGEEFNINSPKQLGVILFEHMGLKGGKKTKTGYSTSVDVLEKLEGKYPIVAYVLEYRQLTKLKSTYADGLANFIMEDNRIHGKFNQTITATGRISSTEPNLQNIPARMELGRAIRKVFLPEDGYVFLDADYSQIELRVMAHLSGDQNLIESYQREEDIHARTAADVFKVPMEEVTSLQRRNAKAVNFGIIYGQSAFGLSQELKITRKEASEYIATYFETYPKVKEYLDREVEKGKKDGFVETMFHRIRPIPELKSSNFMQRNFGERVAMNSPIQGAAADIIKIAMIRVNMRLKKLNLKSRLILQIHDELLIETWKEELDQVKDILVQEMTHAAQLRVPLSVDVNIGENWYEAK